MALYEPPPIANICITKTDKGGPVMGWQGRVLRIDLGAMTAKEEPLNMEWAERYLGQRGLASKYLFEEMDPKADPLSPENKMIFATGPLTGTFASTGGRWSVVTKGALTNAIAARGANGQVLWCGVRDLEQIMDMEELVTYHRGNDPTAIGDVTLTGINVPCRIGNAICMPGDVVLGTRAGLLFVPPHLAEECCTRAEHVQLREIFQFKRIHEGVYNSFQMDSKWSEEIEQDFKAWRATDMPEEFQHLTFEEDKPKDDQAQSEAGTSL